MSHSAAPLAAFHLIGDRSGLDPAEAGLRGLRPALFSNYQDLSGLRYDYPLVLISGPAKALADGVWVKSLSDIIDGILQQISEPGPQGEEIRRHLLSLEKTIRSLVASGQRGSLSLFWEAARRRLLGGEGESPARTPVESLSINLQLARDALDLDGEIIDCNQTLAAALVSRAWQESERLKSERLRQRVERLAQKLTDILKVDDMHSPAAREADRLESTMGSANESVFDFQAMARILRSAPVADPMPAHRRERIRAAIKVFKTQHFVAVPGEEAARNSRIYRFSFNDCQTALAKFRERLPMMAALIRAISIAQLEIENRYDDSRHDEYFGHFDENRLGPGDLELFPSYLLCLDNIDSGGQSAILEVLRLGLPFKIVAQTNDILVDDVISSGRLSFGAHGQQLARMAIGLENVFVMQAASSSLYRLRAYVSQGLTSDRPALFSIFSGSGGDSPAEETDNSAYLTAAAATESRAFPCFVCDPAAGREQLTRFHLDGNPQPGQDWPAHSLHYEDADHNSQTDDGVFTLLDYIAADPRYADRFACVPRDDWNGAMVPAGDYLEMSSTQSANKVPYLQLIDQENILHRAVFDDRLIDAARRCRDAWHSLQELGGINNSHAAAAVAQAQQAWDAEKEILATQAAVPASTPMPVPAAELVPDSSAIVPPQPEAAATVAEEPIPSSDDPWIETIRCTTCNECTELNDRMFAYDEDMRAYIADPEAGTYRELVEAAETCQVAIIHPGKPRNPDEPNLEELIERAEPFL